MNPRNIALRFRLNGTKSTTPWANQWWKKVSPALLLEEAISIVNHPHTLSLPSAPTKVVAEVGGETGFRKWYLIDTNAKTVVLLESFNIRKDGPIRPGSPFWRKIERLSGEAH